MLKNVGICAAIGAVLVIVYVASGGLAFLFAAITAGMVTLTLRKARELGDVPAGMRAVHWVVSLVLVGMVGMVGMVIHIGFRQVHPLYLLMLAMMAVGMHSSVSSRGGQSAGQR